MYGPILTEDLGELSHAFARKSALVLASSCSHCTRICPNLFAPKRGRIAAFRNGYKLKQPKFGTANKFSSVENYIETFPEDVQLILAKMRQTIRKAAPGAVEGISYGIPTFKLNGKNLVHFAGWKNHIGFYPAPSGTSAFSRELARYKAGKGSVRFPLDTPIPFGLVKRIVNFRVEEDKRAHRLTGKVERRRQKRQD